MAEQRPRMYSAARQVVNAPAGGGVNLSVKDILAILRRHVLLIIISTIIGGVVGTGLFYVLQRMYPRYTAQTYIKVLPPTDKDPMMIMSPMLQKDILYEHRASMAALIMQQSSLTNLLDRAAVKETGWFKQFGEEDDRGGALAKAYKKLKKNLRAHPERERDFISVSMTCGDGKDAADIVNEMVTIFLRGQGDTKEDDIGKKLKQLVAQRNVLDGEVKAYQKNLEVIRTELSGEIDVGIPDFEETDYRDTITMTLDNLRIQLDDLNLQIQEYERIKSNLSDQATGPINEQVENQIETDPTMVLLAQQVAQYESQLASLLTKFGENHRVVRQFRELLEETKQRRLMRRTEIAEQTRQSNLQNADDALEVLNSKRVKLVNMQADANEDKQALENARVKYLQAKELRDERQERLDEVKAAIESFRAMQDSPESVKVQFVGNAPVPLLMSFPRLIIFVPAGVMLGLFAGLGLAFLVEFFNDLVRTPRDVMHYLRIPLLGVIPDKRQDSSLRKVGPCNVVKDRPYSILSESYRGFRTSLRTYESSSDARVLLVSGASAGEGDCAVAANLAVTMIGESKKVLLIDTNFRNPVLSGVFAGSRDDSQALGLIDYLSGDCGLSDVIGRSGLSGLDIIRSGQFKSNPAELLGSESMDKLLVAVSEHYDFVIIVGPPLLLLTDSKILAHKADATVLVVDASSTSRGAAQRAIREIGEVNARIAGCVLYGVVALKGGYFNEQYKQYRAYTKKQLSHSV